MMLERRKFERVACYMIARHTGCNSEEEDFFGVVRNISNGGAMIETDCSVAVGTQMDLALLLEQENQIWETRGQVVWARQKQGQTIFGLQFNVPLEENWQRSFPNIERRRHPRLPCQLTASWSHWHSSQTKMMGTVYNLSTGGAMLETDYEVEIGDQLDLIFANESHQWIWEGRGKVIWTKVKENKIQLGMQFLEPLTEGWQDKIRS